MKVGDKVTYVPEHLNGDPANWQHGIVKSVGPDSDGCLFVVFHCAGNWENYWRYTGQLTKASDLKPGWLDKEAYQLLMPKGKPIGDD